jgi:hypothetical protein
MGISLSNIEKAVDLLGGSQKIILWNSKIDGCDLGTSKMAGFDNKGTKS